MPPIPNVVDIPNLEVTQCLTTPPRVFHRNPNYLIDIDANILKPMVDKIPKHTFQRHANQIWKIFFDPLNETTRCQLLVEMMRNMKFRPIMKMG